MAKYTEEEQKLVSAAMQIVRRGRVNAGRRPNPIVCPFPSCAGEEPVQGMERFRKHLREVHGYHFSKIVGPGSVVKSRAEVKLIVKVNGDRKQDGPEYRAEAARRRMNLKFG